MLCIRIVEEYKCSVIRRALFRVYTDAVREKQQALQLQEFAALLQLFDVIKYGTKIRIAVSADIKVLQHVIEMLRVGDFGIRLDACVALYDMQVYLSEEILLLHKYRERLVKEFLYYFACA